MIRYLCLIVLLAGCGANEVPPSERVFVVSSDEALHGGSYLRPSPDGNVVADVDGNLLEDVMTCGFVDLRVVNDLGRLHGSGFEIWIPERSMTVEQRRCLAKKLPDPSHVNGPMLISEELKRVGL
jgi:hypothetical protein